jgi:hypothetical protein
MHELQNILEEIRDLIRAGRSEPPADGKQIPGCLPPGYDLDSLLTPEQYCIWQQCCRAWFSARKHHMRGVIIHSRDMVRVHPRTYLDKSLK